MKSPFYLVITTLLITRGALSQPGGGGGLNISYLTHFLGDTLSLSDENLKIDHYVMNKKFSDMEFQFIDFQKDKHTYYTGEREWFYLPPGYYDKKYKQCANQRLDIIYKADTMTIDFVGVMNENGIGRTEQLDCIRFFPGYYKMHLTESERFDSCWNFRDQYPEQIEKLQADMKAGITNYTINNLKGWHILEEAFNPDLNIIWARYNREYCNETGQGTLPGNSTRLCEGMITLTNTHIYISTTQKSINTGDTLTLSYYYYFSFGTRQFPVISVSDRANSKHQNFPAEETRIAQSYLDALEKLTLYINGNRYTGKLILFVSRNYPGLFTQYHLEETHFYYTDGKLVHKYIPINASPSFNKKDY